MRFILSNIYNIVHIVFQLIEFVILIRIILSWLPIGKNAFTNAVYNLTEPFLQPIRNLLRKSPLGQGLMLDFSPFILMLIFAFIEKIILVLILSYL